MNVAEIEQTVRDTPGVAELYRPGGAAAQAVALGARLLGGGTADAGLVRAVEQDGRREVQLSLGVAPGHRAGEVSRDAARRVRALFPEAERASVDVRVTVAHVEEEPSTDTPERSAV